MMVRLFGWISCPAFLAEKGDDEREDRVTRFHADNVTACELDDFAHQSCIDELGLEDLTAEMERRGWHRGWVEATLGAEGGGSLTFKCEQIRLVSASRFESNDNRYDGRPLRSVTGHRLGAVPEEIIEGALQLIEACGEWPSFRGAELLRIVLDTNGDETHRGPALRLVIRLDRTAQGKHSREERFLLTELKLCSVRQFRLRGFSTRNFIEELVLDDRNFELRSLGYERGWIEFRLDGEGPSSAGCGIVGPFRCEKIELARVAPCDEPGRVKAE